MSFRRWLSNSGEKRRSARIQPEGLVAFYWTGSIPLPNPVRDIGLHGARIDSPAGFQFYVGTLVEIVFENQTVDRTAGVGKHHICTCGKVLRTDDDGFCVEFVFDDAAARRKFRQFLGALKRRNGNETNTEKTPNIHRAGTN